MVGGLGLDSPVCRKDANILGSPNSFTKWDPQALRAGYEIFAAFTAEDVFATSGWLLESYGRKGPKDVPVDSTAVPAEERERHLLTSPMFWWDGNDGQNEQKALKAAREFQQAIRNEEEPHSYVNYAIGGEPMEEVYGRDAERIQKLRTLKRKWDPSNKFGFYAPIH